MQRFSFALTTLVVLVVFLTPSIVFSILKYNGLEDISFASTFEPDQGEVAGCTLRLKFDSFQKDVQDGNPCGVVLCEAGSCAGHLDYQQSVDTFAANDAIGQKAEAAYAELTSSEEPVDDTADGSGDTATGSQGTYDYPLWQWLSIFSVAITFSTIGVASSLAARNRTILGLHIDGTVSSVFVVYFFSALSGVLVVCIFASGIVQGQLFPSFSGDIENFGFNSWSALKFRGSDWFKLALWAYISGFYERFLPQMLDRIVQRARDDQGDARGADDQPKEA